MIVFIGTYTGESGSEGIYRADFDPDSGRLELLEVAANLPNPSYLTFDPVKPVLYSVAEDADGMVASFRMGEGGKLTEINRVPSGGSSTCHVAASRDGRLVFVANYGSGTVSSIR